jgi:hypothetical protein
MTDFEDAKAREFELSGATIQYRLKNGWPVGLALTTPGTGPRKKS